MVNGTVGFWPIFATLVAAFVGALALFATASVSHSSKISEFRQAWINDLRKDISDFIGVAEQWFRKWDELNDLRSHDEKSARIPQESIPLSNEARVILNRIKMRFNPRANKYKLQDDAFLMLLNSLLDPGKLAPPDFDTSWRRLADDAVEKAREILKREWEVTKTFPLCRYLMRK